MSNPWLLSVSYLIVAGQAARVHDSYSDYGKKSPADQVQSVRRMGKMWSAIRLNWKYTAIVAGVAITIGIWKLNPTQNSFRELPHLEDLVNNYEPSSPSVQVLSPQNDVMIAGPIEFLWRLAPVPHYLEILYNQANKLETILIDKDQYIYGKRLSPGLYYWKLLRGDELIYVGKFEVQPK